MPLELVHLLGPTPGGVYLHVTNEGVRAVVGPYMRPEAVRRADWWRTTMRAAATVRDRPQVAEPHDGCTWYAVAVRSTGAKLVAGPFVSRKAAKRFMTPIAAAPGADFYNMDADYLEPPSYGHAARTMRALQGYEAERRRLRGKQGHRP